jgi:hypothetical protein
MQEYLFPTAKGNLKLIIVNSIEPNNGRMLNEVQLFLNNEDKTAEYFENDNYINYYLNEYQAMSDDKKWIYIPKETNHFIINSETLEKIVLPNLKLSAASFSRNIFYQQILIIFGYKQIIITNLETNDCENIWL